MDHGDVLIRFDDVSFEYNKNKPILKQASFSVRENAKITIVGQNGAGKSTIFKMMMGELTPQKGEIHIRGGATIGIASQVMPQEYMPLTVKEVFEKQFSEKKHDIDRDIAKVMDAVQLSVPTSWVVDDLSGGQQARLLLALAIIKEPDVLLLDEPTNNLDTAGINHLIGFLLGYDKTVIVISHDAAFLNMFTDGVLHLDVFKRQVKQYVGDYYDVVEEIAAQVQREERKNAQLKKNIQDRKAKVNQFSNKGGKMRRLASKLKDEIAEDEANMVSVSKEDKTIPPFTIPVQDWSGSVGRINELTVLKDGQPQSKDVDIEIRQGDIIRITGPNGIGKTTMLQGMASAQHDGMTIKPEVRLGYYRQDFSGLNFDQNAFESLKEVMVEGNDEDAYSVAARFLLRGDTLHTSIGTLSEGQKGLLSYARFVLQEPALLVLDEPSNHINFRHLPIIAQALNDFAGAIILVSHDEEFVDQIQISQTIDLEKKFA